MSSEHQTLAPSPINLFFPGLGADSTLAKYHSLKGPCLWIEWPNNIATTWDDFLDSLQSQIPQGVPLRFVGISFGGLVAIKMAERIPPVGGVFLVGSLVDRSEIRVVFQILLLLVRYLPTFAFDLRLLPKFVIRYFFGIQAKQHVDEFLIMASRLPGRSVKSLCQLVASWSGVNTSNVQRIHGSLDRIIKPERKTAKLLRGGHLISMTNSQEVNAWLEDRARLSADVSRNQSPGWRPFENGQTFGTTGSERGQILKDEEHEMGARITLEKGKSPSFAITCGIYGTMVHTAFASSLEEAEAKYQRMKWQLDHLLQEGDTANFYSQLELFIEEF